MKRNQKRFFDYCLVVGLIVTLTFVMAACSSTKTSTSTPTPTSTATATPTLTSPLFSIAVTPASPANLTVGSTQQFTATGTYSDGSTKHITSQITWASSLTAVATISPAGSATGVAAGITYITATLNTITSPSVSLTVIAAPSVTTNAATNITGNTATLEGTVNPKTADTVVTFEYGADTSYGTTVTATPSTVSAGAGNTTVSAAITGLTPGIKYHFRVDAASSGGTADGGDQTFTTLATPSATTGAATNITDTTATLNGTANDNGTNTVVSFEYGTDTSYGTTVTATPGFLSAGAGNTTVSTIITGLTPGTKYHFRVDAASTPGTTKGGDQTFTTLALPTVTTGAATNITNSTATLNGTVNANGADTVVTFEYAAGYSTYTTLTTFATVVASPSPVSGSSATAVSVTLTGLNAGTSYYFEVVATNSVGTTYGPILYFTTAYP